MVYTLKEIKKLIIPIAKKYDLDSISLFGSYANGKATSTSDIDLIIDKGNLVGI